MFGNTGAKPPSCPRRVHVRK